MKHFTNESITPEAFQRAIYSDKSRWVSYYHQISLVKSLINNGSVVEIGVGNKVVAKYLKTMFDVATVDIIESLEPDYVASVEDLSMFQNESFDVALCAEVLEHLPFEKLLVCLSELGRITKQYVIISLPYWGYTFGLELRLPKLGTKIFKFKISGIKKHKFNGQHYWEIGKKGYSLKLIKNKINEANFSIIRSFWDIHDPYHYYFVLKKQ